MSHVAFEASYALTGFDREFKRATGAFEIF